MVNVLGEAALFPKLDPPKDEDPEPQTCCAITFTWPKASLLVYLNECAERFVFYGIKAVLTIYLMKEVGLDPRTAMMIFHAFIALSYIFPLIGGYAADAIFGRFWTIFWFSTIYLSGLLILAVAAMLPKGYPLHPWVSSSSFRYLDFFALLVIAIGVGGVKPVLPVMGADQFKMHHLSVISIFFAMFYLFVNVGGLLGVIFLPGFAMMPCMGKQSCFPLTFGVGFVVLLTTTVLFTLGACLYKPILPVPGVFAKALNTVALYVKFKGIGITREHWLDYYLNIHDCTKHLECIQAAKTRVPGDPPNCPQAKFIEDVKAILRLNHIQIPIIFFWALYDQQSSRWPVQAAGMDPQVSEGIFVLPEHLALFQAVLLITFIPIFQFLIYPLLASCGVRYLKRMIVGGIFAVLAFVLAGIIQMGLNQTMPISPPSGYATLSVVNAFGPGCRLVVADVPGYVTPASLTDNPLAARQESYQIQVGGSSQITPGIQMNGSCSGRRFVRYPLALSSGESRYIVIMPQGVFSHITDYSKPMGVGGASYVSVNFLIPCKFLPAGLKENAGCFGLTGTLNALTPYTGPLALCRVNPNSSIPCNPAEQGGFFQWDGPSELGALKDFPPTGDHPNGRAQYSHYGQATVLPGAYFLYYVKPGEAVEYVLVEQSQISVSGIGAIYVLSVGLADSVLVDSDVSNTQAIHLVSPPNYMGVVWIFPQYVLMAIAEIMFAITGLEFVYAQSVPPLKAFLMSLWMMNIGLGNALVVLIEMHNPFTNLAHEFFAYALGLTLILILFVYMGIFYPYANYTGIAEEEKGLLGNPRDLGIDNEGYVNTLVTRL